MKPRVVIARPFTGRLADTARDYFDAYIAEETMETEPALAIAQSFQPAGIVFGAHLKLGAHAIQALPDSVRVLATTSVGYEHIDIEAAAKRSIVVTNAPSAVTACTADLAMMLMLCACRRAAEYDALVRQGWKHRLAYDELLGVRVTGRRLGLMGMGRVGQAVAQRARGFGMQIHYHDARRLPLELEQSAIYHAELDDMLAVSDILSLHVPGGLGLDGVIDARRLALLPSGAVFVNAARGSLVDEEALIAALQSGRLRAAGLDTFRREPDPDPRLVQLPNVFVTPHMGAATEEARWELGACALENVRAVLAGCPALDPVREVVHG